MCQKQRYINILYFSEISVSLTTAHAFAMVGMPYTFTCTVINYVPMDEKVSFYKTLIKTDNVFAIVNQKQDHCDINKKPPDNYHAYCSKGTDNTMSERKEYILKIIKVSMGDQTKWFCQLGQGKNSTADLVISSKYLCSQCKPNSH